VGLEAAVLRHKRLHPTVCKVPVITERMPE
jgi:hypothetical protein